MQLTQETKVPQDEQNQSADERRRKAYERCLGAVRQNVENALSRASTNQYEDPTRLSRAALSKRTGIARTTLEAINTRSPSLSTLHAIAHELGIPVAFLFMEPQDWMLLRRAYNDFPTVTEAAKKVTDYNSEMKADLLVTDTLDRAGVLKSDIDPSFVKDHTNLVAQRNLEAQEKKRREIMRVLGPLILGKVSKGHPADPKMVPLAAAIANQSKPID